MAAAPLSSFGSLEEYLRADYQPDMDYVDGVLEEETRVKTNGRRYTAS